MFRVILDDACDPFSNMARDEAILRARIDNKVPDTLRFYCWDKPAITLGYFQKAEKELNLKKCAENSISVVRRMTGGRAVLHDNEITYSVTASEDNPLIGKNIKDSFLSISKCISKGLELSGVKCNIIYRPQKTADKNPVCFNSVSWYEISVDGKKIVGTAQTKKSGVILHQGSILLKFDPIKIVNNFNFKNKNKFELIDNLNKKIIGLEQLNNKKIEYEKIRNYFLEGFKNTWNTDFFQSQLTEEEKEEEIVLLKEKYSTEEWNYGTERKKKNEICI